MSDAHLSKRLVYSDAGIAAIAQAWLDGHSQKEIATRVFGYKTASIISVRMVMFVNKFADPLRGYLEPSKQWVPAAIANYLASRSNA